MKNLKPVHVLLIGSVVVSVLSFLLLIVLNQSVGVPSLYFLLFPLLTGGLSYLVFYVLLRRFITQKLKILYRSIRKGKIINQHNENFSLFDDVIERAEVETKKWTEERTQEINKLKEQEEFRREFLGNLAHELKTPVFSIQGYILTLLEGGLEDDNVNRQFLERASKATDRMTTILEDLDKIAKMEVGVIELDYSHFDIVELVDDIFDELEGRAKKRKIKLKFAKDFDPIFVYADKGKITQVLTNLIGNSISYGNDGGETNIRFYILNNIITVEVSDNGPGIPEEDLPRLFERFYRVEKSRNRNAGGSGLGLSIARHFIEAHGQTISVRSTLGVGSTFTFGLDRGKRNLA
ncbi:MAG: ATP-binding protein [bacterium]|nr:ATP-binding protein [bacterium]